LLVLTLSEEQAASGSRRFELGPVILSKAEMFFAGLHGHVTPLDQFAPLSARNPHLALKVPIAELTEAELARFGFAREVGDGRVTLKPLRPDARAPFHWQRAPKGG
jgi:hypothetical protein